MSKDNTPPDAAQNAHRVTTPGHREVRAEALQRALRDNLRRRKAAATGAKATSSEDETTRKNDD